MGAATRTCDIEGCDRKHKANGLCNNHAQLARRNGTPEYAPPRPVLACKVEGCSNKYRCSGYCGMHYNRWRASGDPGPSGRVLFPAGLTCADDGCDLPARNKGRCDRHAMRAKRAADRASGKVTRIAHWANLEERLQHAGWTVVTRKPELGACWEWAGILDKKGYGRAHVGNQKTGAAHRAAYQVWNNGGETVDSSRYVCHKCDNPPCINPAHLFLGDQFANMGDAKTKLRMANGMRQGRAKLTDQQVSEIREKHATRQYSQKRLGDEYGVSQSHIGGIVKYKCWKTPTNPPIAA